MSENTSTSLKGSARPGHRITQRAGGLVFGLMLTAIVYLFYLGGYRHLLVDESASFSVELKMRIMDGNRAARLLVIGNSAAAEGFRGSIYTQDTAGSAALNLGVGSAHFFAFEKLAEAAFRRGMSLESVLLVLTPESLSVRPGYDEIFNDMTLVKTELDIGDYRRLWSHRRDYAAYLSHAGHLALRPALFSGDVRDILVNLRERTRNIPIARQWLESASGNLAGLEPANDYAVCDAGPLRDLEFTLAAERRIAGSQRLAHLERVWAGHSVRVHQPLDVDSRQARRLAHLLNVLTRGVERVFVAIAPYYDPDYDAYPADYRDAFVRAVQEVTGEFPTARLLPEFRADCTLFVDTVHLNRAGGEAFTRFLRQQMSTVN